MEQCIDWSLKFSKSMSAMLDSGIKDVLEVAADKSVISFSGGIPDSNFFPTQMLHDAFTNIFSNTERCNVAFQYSNSNGYDPLRDLIASQVRMQGGNADRNSIVIVNGAQQAIDLIGRIMINPNDRIIVSNPTYLGLLMSLSVYRPKYAPIDSDEDGILIPALEEELAKGAKFIYLVPDFQNPTGNTLSSQRRKEILDLAEHYQTPIVEDSPYRLLSYDIEPPKPLFCINKNASNLVIQLGTISKVIAPGLRVGWVIANPSVASKISKVKQSADLCTSILNQMVVKKILKDSVGFNKHINRLRSEYKLRRNAMIEALCQKMPDGVSWNRPGGGMFVWLKLPMYISSQEVFKKSREYKKLVVVPGNYFFPNGGGSNAIRLSFSAMNSNMIYEGIDRLSQIIKQEMVLSSAQKRNIIDGFKYE